MEPASAAKIFDALASPRRLEIFRTLVRQGDCGMVAKELATVVGLSPSNLSFHIKALLYSNLVLKEQEGQFIRFFANIPEMLETIAYLTEECCAGNPEACSRYRKKSAVSPHFSPKPKKRRGYR